MTKKAGKVGNYNDYLTLPKVTFGGDNRRFGFGRVDNRRFCRRSYRRYLRSFTSFRHSASHLIVIYYMEACHQSGKHGHFMDGININIHAFEFAGKRSWLHGPRALRNCARHRFRGRKTKLGLKSHFTNTLLSQEKIGKKSACFSRVRHSGWGSVHSGISGFARVSCRQPECTLFARNFLAGPEYGSRTVPEKSHFLSVRT